MTTTETIRSTVAMTGTAISAQAHEVVAKVRDSVSRVSETALDHVQKSAQRGAERAAHAADAASSAASDLGTKASATYDLATKQVQALGPTLTNPWMVAAVGIAAGSLVRAAMASRGAEGAGPPSRRLRDAVDVASDASAAAWRVTSAAASRAYEVGQTFASDGGRSMAPLALGLAAGGAVRLIKQTIKASHEEVAELSAKVRRLHAALDAAQVQRSSLHAQLAQRGAETEQLRKSLSELGQSASTEAASLRDQLNMGRRERADIEARVQSALTEAASLREQLTNAASQQLGMESRLRTAEAEASSLGLQLNASLEEKAAVQARLEETQKELSNSVRMTKLEPGAAAAVRKLVEALRNGSAPQEAALLIAGYDRARVDAATATADRSDVQALQRLLSKGGWRAYAVRWLLGVSA